MEGGREALAGGGVLSIFAPDGLAERRLLRAMDGTGQDMGHPGQEMAEEGERATRARKGHMMGLRRTMAGWAAELRRRRRIRRDALTIGSAEWADFLGGWFDDVAVFRAEPDGGIRLRELDVAVPREIGRWLLGRNSNYAYCRDLAKAGARFSMESGGLEAHCMGGVFPLEVDSLFILWELVVEHAYPWMLPGRPSLVFDVGMNVGFSSLLFALRDPEAIVVGFEPVSTTYERLRKNLAKNPGAAGRIHAENQGLSDHDGEETWHVCENNSTLSSVYAQDAGGMVPTKVALKSATAAMEPFLAAHPNRLCMVKMDCEGGEYAVLDDWARNGLAEKIDVLAMEYHEIGGHGLAEIEEWCRSNGFFAVVIPNKMQGIGMQTGMVYSVRLNAGR